MNDATEETIIERGDLLLKCGYEIRVMANVDKWVMARRKGCSPFLIDLRTASEMPIAKQAKRPKGWKVTPK